MEPLWSKAQAKVWVIEGLARSLRHEVDPLEVRQHVRDLPTLTAAAAAVGLMIDPAMANKTVPRATLGTAANGWKSVLVSDRHGDEVLVERPGDEPEWTRLDALEVPADADWVTAVTSAPLNELAHHPTPAARLWALLRLEGDELRVIVVYAAVVGLLTLAAPIAVQALVGSVAFGTLLQPIVVLSVLLLAALSFQSTIKALQARLVEAIQERLFVRTAMDLAWRLPRVKREEVDHGFGPATVNHFFDVMTLQKTASILLTDGIATVLQVAIGLLVLAFYHPALLGFAIVLVMVIALVVAVPWRAGLSTSIDESKAKYGVAGWLQTIASSTAVFRGAEGAQFALERADALTRRYLDLRRRHFSVLFGQTLGALGLQVIASAALLGLGGWLVLRRELTLGQLIAAELIVASITSGLGKGGKLLDNAYDLMTSLDKLGHVLDLPIEEERHGEAIPSHGPVRVEVHRAGEGEHVPLSFDVQAGTKLAIVGAEGHPLAEWLAGLRLPSAGSVVLNGVETSRARTPLLREHVSLIQRGDVFEGSVLENVTICRKTVTTADARGALERVGLLDTLRALPDGIDTRMTWSGAPFTHSNVVQMMVSRAIAGNPRLIIVNESLESIHPVARAHCVAALTRPDAPWTLIALVTDPSVALARGCTLVRTLEQLGERKGAS